MLATEEDGTTPTERNAPSQTEQDGSASAELHAPSQAEEAAPMHAEEAAPAYAAEAAPSQVEEVGPVHAAQAIPVHAEEIAPVHAAEDAPAQAGEIAPVEEAVPSQVEEVSAVAEVVPSQDEVAAPAQVEEAAPVAETARAHAEETASTPAEEIAPAQPEPHPPSRPIQLVPSEPLEQWAANETMRHIPTLAWMAQKLDHDLRHRIDRLWFPYSDLPASDPHHAAIEAEFRALCRALERVSHVAVRHRGGLHPPNDLGSRIGWLVSHAVQCLNTADTTTFGRRLPFHLFERSNAEPLWAAMLTVIQHVQELTDLVRAIDPGIDERMYEELVQLREPLRREPMA